MRKSDDEPIGLQPDPIPQDWILEGQPMARRKYLVGSSDERSSTHLWDCTAGRFNWYYGCDEVIHVLEGAVEVEDAAGVRRRLEPGDTFLFPAGTCFHWTVPQYVRKIAFLHSPFSRKVRVLRRLYRVLTGPFQPKTKPMWTG